MWLLGRAVENSAKTRGHSALELPAPSAARRSRRQGCPGQVGRRYGRMRRASMERQRFERLVEKALDGLRSRGHEVVPRNETYSTVRFSRPIGIRVTAKGLEAGLDALGAAAAAGH